MKLDNGEARCSDALEAGCPDRKNCARWTDRNAGAFWVALAQHRGERCEHQIKIEETRNAETL